MLSSAVSPTDAYDARPDNNPLEREFEMGRAWKNREPCLLLCHLRLTQPKTTTFTIAATYSNLERNIVNTSYDARFVRRNILFGRKNVGE